MPNRAAELSFADKNADGRAAPQRCTSGNTTKRADDVLLKPKGHGGIMLKGQVASRTHRLGCECNVQRSTCEMQHPMHSVQHANMQKRRLIASEVKASHSCTGAPRAVVMKQQSPGSAQAGPSRVSTVSRAAEAGPSRVCRGRAKPGLQRPGQAGSAEAGLYKTDGKA